MYFMFLRTFDFRMITLSQNFPKNNSFLIAEKPVAVALVGVEDLNVITALKCNKLLSVITFGLKCNNVIPTS